MTVKGPEIRAFFHARPGISLGFRALTRRCCTRLRSRLVTATHSRSPDSLRGPSGRGDCGVAEDGYGGFFALFLGDGVTDCPAPRVRGEPACEVRSGDDLAEGAPQVVQVQGSSTVGSEGEPVLGGWDATKQNGCCPLIGPHQTHLVCLVCAPARCSRRESRSWAAFARAGRLLPSGLAVDDCAVDPTEWDMSSNAIGADRFDGEGLLAGQQRVLTLHPGARDFGWYLVNAAFRTGRYGEYQRLLLVRDVESGFTES